MLKLTSESLSKAREKLSKRFSPEIADALIKRLREFLEDWAERFPAIKKEHKKWPEIVRLESKLLQALKSCAHAEISKGLETSLEEHLKKMRRFIAQLPPRKWRDNDLFYELAFSVGRTLQEHNIEPTTYEDDTDRKRGRFAFAVAVAFQACGSNVKRVKNDYVTEAIARLKSTPMFILSSFPQRHRPVTTKKKPVRPKKTAHRYQPYKPQNSKV
jgi:hypothetical protein